MKKTIFTLILSFCICGTYVRAQQTLDERINAIISQMTDQEKIQQLINSSFGGTPSNGRLGIPGFEMSDGPHGVRFNDNTGRRATSFPTGIALAASWDKDISFKVGQALGTEFWAFGFNVALGPCIDISRDPRAGRNAESGGEDPYLAGHMGKNWTQGLEGTYPVMASVKHFMGESRQTNGGNQYYRHEARYTASERWLMDFLMYNFRTTIQESGALCVMNSYNWFNGVKVSESTELMQTILRDRWGFPFFVVSDWGNIDRYRSEYAIKAGTDICMGDGYHTGKNWKAYEAELPAVIQTEDGRKAIEAAVYRVLKTKILNGMLDTAIPASNSSNAMTPEIVELNKEAARKSLVLLKNQDNILPLNKNIKVAVIGPNAAEENLNCSGSSATNPPYAVSVLKGIQDKIGADNVTYVEGCKRNDNNTSGFAAARAAAQAADMVIFAGGLSRYEEGEGFDEGWDRSTIFLPGRQQDLIRELASVNPNLVVVIQSGGICSLDDNTANAIKGFVYSFYAAQEAGVAIADVLFGDYNPAGRLPVTMARDLAQLPAWNESWDDDYGTGYRWFDERGYTPRYAFGYGLSYTTFSYSNITAPSSVAAGQPFSVTVDVTNTGNNDGEEVAQLYVSSPSDAGVWFPKKELRGFERISLNKGETKTVTFNMVADDFYYWNTTTKQYEVLPGNYVIRAGSSSDNLPLSRQIVFNNADKKPDLKVTQIYTMPRYPQEGESVRFYALVKNQGNATASGVFDIDFSVGGQVVASATGATTEIAAGQVQLIESTGVWTANGVGAYNVSAKVNAGNTIDEWDDANNVFEKAREVLPPAPINLALNKPVEYTGGIQDNDPQFSESNLTDGLLSSRWATPHGQNDKTFIIDLETISSINEILITWEAAFASLFNVELSTDKSNWTSVYSGTGTAGKQSISVNAILARYVKVDCVNRVTQYGFSIYEVEVYGDNLTSIEEPNSISPRLSVVDKKLYLTDSNQSISSVRIVDTNGKIVLSQSISKDGFVADIQNWVSGVYIAQLLGGNSEIVQKIIL